MRRKVQSAVRGIALAVAATSVALSSLLGVTALMARPAAAAGYGWDYISLPTWLANCPGGGSVKYMQVMVGSTWSGGDYGDDLVYARVVVGDDQPVVGKGLCYNGNRSYWGPDFYQTIHPNRSNQTWWVGPAGVRSN